MTRTTLAVLVAVAVLATVLPATWFLGEPDPPPVAVVAAMIAYVAGIAALSAALRGRSVVAGGCLLVTAVAPTYFFYLGNVACLVLGAYLLVRRPRLV